MYNIIVGPVLETRGPVVFAKAHRLCLTYLIAAKAEFNTLLQLGIV